jgi:hypothetical protein
VNIEIPDHGSPGEIHQCETNHRKVAVAGLETAQRVGGRILLMERLINKLQSIDELDRGGKADLNMVGVKEKRAFNSSESRDRFEREQLKKGGKRHKGTGKRCE